MKKIIIVLLAIFTTGLLAQCDKKDDDGKGGSRTERFFRVKRITGDNLKWGKFELLFCYSDGKLDTVWRRNLAQDESLRDTMGRFSVSYENNSTVVNIKDYVLNIDADSVAKLQAAYPATYSDSLRRRRVSRTLLTRTLYQVDNYTTQRLYTPREEVGMGAGFDNRYKVLQNVRSLYEYDAQGQTTVIRQFVDDYKQDELNTDYTRMIDKYEFTYGPNGPATVAYYVQDSYDVESWKLRYSCTYTYSGRELSQIEGKGYRWLRSGTSLTITDTDGITKCTLDGNDNVVAVTYPDGSQISLEYEDGRGNACELLYPADYILRGRALIR